MKVGYWNAASLFSSSTLYPTWFRWKLIKDMYFSGVKGFISHMVQMKAPDLFFILRKEMTFISHMVQMKAPDLFFILRKEMTFISHMVQMKVKSTFTKGLDISYFISHMVQMKASNVYRTRQFGWLYIPHGSDERTCKNLWWGDDSAFISHMVQMKVESCKALSSPSPSLYPTWFRWKPERVYPGFVKSLSFISHMVQMKECKRTHTLWCYLSLYPTWFRWKMKKLQRL